jgi:hypothetical protein
MGVDGKGLLRGWLMGADYTAHLSSALTVAIDGGSGLREVAFNYRLKVEVSLESQIL